MNPLQALAMLLAALRALPVEIVAALWRLLILLLLLIFYLLKLVIDFLRRAAGKPESEKNPRDDCGELPPHVKRKPDPCLYSQPYLIAQGLAVTWDNPDIWITKLDGSVVDSHGLTPDTDYVVNARIWDASFDPSLATEVRCFYRPWSFNNPNRTPVETMPNGSERVVILHVLPWSNEIARFRWHTPNLAPHHWCLQVECRHPDDKNPNNNLGQENTDVIGVAAGTTVEFKVQLYNPAERERLFRIMADAYEIPKGEVRFDLETRTRPLRRRQPFDFLHQGMVTRDPVKGGLRLQDTRGPVWTSYRWRGIEPVRAANRAGNFGLSAGWNATADGVPVGKKGAEVGLGPGALREVPLAISVPPSAIAGTRQNVNVTAFTDLGKVAGGVTIRVEVKQ